MGVLQIINCKLQVRDIFISQSSRYDLERLNEIKIDPVFRRNRNLGID